MWLDVNYLTRLPVFDIVLLFVLLFRWTLDGFIFGGGSETRLLRWEKNITQMYSPLENLNGMFENLNHIFILRTPDGIARTPG